MKLYYKATSPLTGEDRFDGTPRKVVVFLATVQDQALNFGWSDILTIPDNNGVNHNIIQEYGSLTMLNVPFHTTAYVGQLTRQAQNMQMLYHFIIKSLTSTFMGQVLLYQSHYKINGAYNGSALLHQILSLTYIDMSTTTLHLQTP